MKTELKLIVTSLQERIQKDKLEKEEKENRP